MCGRAPQAERPVRAGRGSPGASWDLFSRVGFLSASSSPSLQLSSAFPFLAEASFLSVFCSYL